MTFRYKKIGASFLRPIIPVEFNYGNEKARHEVLVDSGADMNIVSAEIGEILGIDVEAGKKDYVGGITGGGMPYFIHSITLRVGGWAFTDIPVGFMPDMPKLGYGVVGQQGFFDLFKITFDQYKGEIELKPY